MRLSMGRPSGVLLTVYADQEHPLTVVGFDAGGLNILGKLDGAFEMAVRDFHLDIGAGLLLAPIAANAPDRDPRAMDGDINILSPHAGEVKLENPPLARPEDIHCRLPIDIPPHLGLR